MDRKHRDGAPGVPAEERTTESVPPEHGALTPASPERVSVVPAEERTKAERAAIKAIQADLQPNPVSSPLPPPGELRGDFRALEVHEGQLQIAGHDHAELTHAVQGLVEAVRATPVATSVGYRVPGAYDIRIQGWTTQARILTLPDGRRAFALHSYPAGAKRRRMDRFFEWVSGDPMRKPRPRDWKRIVESRSCIPTFAGMPADTVVMPYLPSLNAYDLFAHQREIGDFGPFPWAKEASVEERLALIPSIARALRELHASGRTWGEAILPNVIFNEHRQPVFVDPETTYGGIPYDEQRARDIRALASSAFGALARTEGFSDVQRVVNLILQGYDDPSVRAPLAALGKSRVPWRYRLLFNVFHKFRVGATNLDEFLHVHRTLADVGAS